MKIYFLLVNCQVLSLEHGTVSYSRPEMNGTIYVDTVANFSCNDGYLSSGSTESTCQPTLTWSQPLPTCVQSNEIILSMYYVPLQNSKSI